MKTTLPLYGDRVAAGFPSPADDHIDQHIDLNDHLIDNPASSFLLRATGESMLNAGIFPEDILVVDRSKQPKSGDVVIAALNGELTVKRLRQQGERFYLMPENPAFKPIALTSQQECHFWGVVTYVLHKP